MEECKSKDPLQRRPRLPPGFRFRPTDEELVVQYLRRRALAAPLPAAVIADVALLAHDPWDLLPGSEEGYFFTCKEAKYGKGRRANRATGAGYWKATGMEKAVVAVAGGGGREVLVGMKRSLVFYRGKPPGGQRTDWVMHEYRLAGAGLAPCRRAQNGAAIHPAEGWVLCRIFRKKRASSSSPSCDPGDVEAKNDVRSVDTGVQFIDFLGQAETRHRRATSPVSASCLTSVSEEHCRGEETTSRGK